MVERLVRTESGFALVEIESVRPVDAAGEERPSFCWSCEERHTCTEKCSALEHWRDEPRCGLCGKPLRECHLGPCPWGSWERPVIIKAEGYEDIVACAMDAGMATSCNDCPINSICQSRAPVPANISNTEFSTGSDNLILGTPGPCFVCGKATPWIEMNFEGHLCSSECSRTIYADLRAKIDAAPDGVVVGIDGSCPD